MLKESFFNFTAPVAEVCKTVSGGTANAPCVFPFVYREIKYTGKFYHFFIH